MLAWKLQRVHCSGILIDRTGVEQYAPSDERNPWKLDTFMSDLSSI
jgi:hypothetical protein